MKISQKLENACRVLAQLARCHESGSVTRLDTLAQREGISSSFLVQILNELKRAGLVDSKRGKAGGYFLPRPPAETSLYDVVAGIEPNLVTDSTSGEGESGASVSQTWQDISSVFDSQLKAITLAKLADQDEPMYFI